MTEETFNAQMVLIILSGAKYVRLKYDHTTIVTPLPKLGTGNHTVRLRAAELQSNKYKDLFLNPRLQSIVGQETDRKYFNED